MARLDVSKAFDKTFLEKLILKEYEYTINAEGVLVRDNEQKSVFYGVVTPIESKATQDGYILDTIEIYTKIKLNIPSHNEQVSIIEYNNTNYRVTSIKDFNNYGKGYNVIIAQNENLSNVRISKL